MHTVLHTIRTYTIRARRFRPATTRYPAYFSQKRITMATEGLGKMTLPTVLRYRVPDNEREVDQVDQNSWDKPAFKLAQGAKRSNLIKTALICNAILKSIYLTRSVTSCHPFASLPGQSITTSRMMKREADESNVFTYTLMVMELSQLCLLSKLTVDGAFYLYANKRVKPQPCLG